MSDKTEHPPLPEAFAKLGVRNSILRALAEMKFETPSEIQDLLIPKALAGGDYLGQARTGTGKTAAFGIPILQRAEKGLATQAIILAPTRELATQIDEELKQIGQYTPIRSLAVYGGQRIAAQMKFISHHPEIIVGTPGRVIDLLDRRILNFNNVRYVVLDEVDRMLDIGFRDDIRNILSRVKGMRRHQNDRQQRDDYRRDGGRHSDIPPTQPAEQVEVDAASTEVDDDTTYRESGASGGGHQTIFVSATISDEIERLARKYMREPVQKLIAPGANDKPTVDKVEQFYISVQPWDKYRLLDRLLKQEQPELAIIFTRTKRGAEKVAKRLTTDGIDCREIHGNLNQSKREKVMKTFRSGKIDVLVATDLASRGIDVDDITHIINYDIPEDPEVYVHRIGRTARMGKAGKAFTFVSKEQGNELTKVESMINMLIPQGVVEGFEPREQPSDWLDGPPAGGRGGFGGRSDGGRGGPRPSGPAFVADFDRPAPTGNPADAPTPVVAKPQNMGGKIPVNRRRRRR